MKFNLEKALTGQLVVLRDGRTAQIMVDLRRNKLEADMAQPLVGVVRKGRSTTYSVMQWRVNGRIFEGVEHPNDIEGMAPSAVFDHWGAVDPKWKFICADRDGTTCLFRDRPYLEDGTWEMESDGTGEHVEVTGVLSLKYTDWETSLVERPA